MKSNNSVIDILVSDEDLTSEEKGIVELEKNKSDRVLGITDATSKAAVAVILRRVLNSVPDHYAIGEITMKFSLSGSIGVVKVGGDVSVKLNPDNSKLS